MKAFFTFVGKVFLAIVAINVAVMAVLGFLGVIGACLQALCEKLGKKKK